MDGFQGAAIEYALIALPSMLLGVFLGPAFGRVARSEMLGLPLSDIHEEATAVAGRISRPERARRETSTSEESDTLALWALGALGVVVFYLNFRVQILIALLLLAVAISTVAVVVLLGASRRGVVAPTYGRAVAFVVPILFSVVGVVTVVFLWDPPAGGAMFTEFVDHFNRTQGFSSLEGVGFVIYQILGGISFIALALGSICFSLSNLSAVYLTGLRPSPTSHAPG
ncbi:hypothetical protein BH23ACT6_BH23ACT6_13010 [soil metagenome]